MKIRFLFYSALLAVSACQPSHRADQDKPNIIFILADDMGYGDVSAFNTNGKIFTENLDQLASEGMIFTDAHTTSAVCTPTRYSILTGRYNFRSRLKSGVLWGMSEGLISKDRTTVASMLKTQGYHTAFIGKWHLGWNWELKDSSGYGKKGWDRNFDNIDFSRPISHSPNDLGFDYSYGHIASLDIPPYVYVEDELATSIPHKHTIDTGKYTWWREGPTADDFIHEDVTPNFFRRAMTYILEHSNEDEPFFLYLPLPSPHTPILPTEDWLGKSGLNPYGDFVLMIDDYIGQLVKTLEEAGEKENTLIIFTSDNGCSPEADLEVLDKEGHVPSYIFRGHKADIYEGGHRVPFIATWPDMIKAGSCCDQTICTVDLMATLADITGYELHDNEAEDSYDLMPLFKGEVINGSLREATIHHSVNGSFAIRKGDWKLIMCGGSGGWSYPRPGDLKKMENAPNIQLYNIKTDPSEQSNLQASYPEIVLELKNLLIKYYNEGRSTPGKPQQNDPSRGQRKEPVFILDSRAVL